MTEFAAFLGTLLGTMLDPPLIILAIAVGRLGRPLPIYARLVGVFAICVVAGAFLKSVLPHPVPFARGEIGKAAIYYGLGGLVWLSIIAAVSSLLKGARN